MTDKLCIDCDHYSPSALRGLCERLRINKSLVTGENKGCIIDASDERYSILPWSCGKKARYFKPKQKNKQDKFPCPPNQGSGASKR